MRQVIWTAAIVLAGTVPGYAQQSVSPQPSGGSESIIRTLPSTGVSSGNSGSVGSPTSVYPAPLRDYNNPAASYGRLPNPSPGSYRR